VSVRQLDVGVFATVASLAAAALAGSGARAGWWASAWFLSRPESLVATIGLGVWRWRTTDAEGRRGVLRALGIFGAVLLTWSAANFVRFGDFTPLSANAGMNLAIGHGPGVAARLGDRTFNPALEPGTLDQTRTPDQPAYESDRAARDLAFARIGDDPATALALVPLKFMRYWDWRLGDNPPHSRVEHLAYSVPYLALLMLASAGAVWLWRAGHRAALIFLLIVMAGYTLPYLAVFGLIRMRMSVEWALILVGAAAVGELRLSPPQHVGSVARLAP